MTLNDPMADALSKMNNAVKALNRKVVMKKSKLLMNVLDLLNKNGYVGKYNVVENGRGGLIEVELLGSMNKCGIIKPRFPVKISELESFERRFLPAKDFGVLILSTNKGLLTQKEAKEQNVGGTLVAYCY